MSETKKILIVDDEPIGRQLLEAILFPEGYSLFFAEDGEKAFNETTEHIPDLVLLDVMMPKMDGFEVCKKIRNQKETAHIPVFLITALDDRDSKIRGIDAGADDYISKPFDRIEILAKVKNSTTLSHMRKAINIEGNSAVAQDYNPQLMNCLIFQLQKPCESCAEKGLMIIRPNGSTKSQHLFSSQKSKHHQYYFLLSNNSNKKDNQLINCLLSDLIREEIQNEQDTVSQIVQQVIQNFNVLVQQFHLKMQEAGITLVIYKTNHTQSKFFVSGINQVVYASSANSMLGTSQNNSQFQPFYLMGNQDIEISNGRAAILFSSNLHKNVTQQEAVSFLNNLHLPEKEADISSKLKDFFKDIDDYVVVNISN